MNKSSMLSVVAALVLISGCASSDSSVVGKVSETTATPSETKLTATASVADYHAIVIKTRKDVDKWVEDWEANTCSALSVGSGKDPLCSTIAARARSVAGIVYSSLSGAQKEGVPAYIGAPPEELSTVLASTIKAAEDADASGADWSLECPGEMCTNRTLMLSMAMEDLQSELDTWEAYVR